MIGKRLSLWVLGLIVLAAGVIGVSRPRPAAAQGEAPTRVIVGRVLDRQNQPVEGVRVTALTGGNSEVIAETLTQPDGSFVLVMSPLIMDSLRLEFERAHFETAGLALVEEDLERLRAQGTVTLPSLTLVRRIGPAFWIATLLFIAMLGLIASGQLHNTLAALVGMAVVYGVSYLGEPLWEELYIFDFARSLQFVDWNVIFLIMGMMIVIAVVERTGIFQWLAFRSYKLSGGRMWLLLTILMIVTGVASAFLDNVTTMLLMTPITIQIAIALNINPLALLMPEVFASNVVGISTLVGTPTNILIGSFGGITFNDFLINLTPGVVLAMVGLVLYSLYVYRKEYRSAGEMSPLLLEKLEERGRITQPDHLRKAGWVGLGMIVLFVFGENIHLLPSVTAMMGATALMVWIRPDIEEMIEAVDWTTLVFFISLFIVVGAVQEVGLISVIAEWIGRLVGDNLPLAMLIIIWLGAVLSTVVANIPFTAAMLPVIGFLTATIPGAESKVLFYCLSVGSAMGGNGSLIGASANLVTAGIAERAGYPITYVYFLKKGFPALLITVGLATVWLFVRF